MFLTNFPLCNEVRLAESIDCDSNEHEADQGSDDDADDLESLEPGLSAPAHSLEHAPESVCEVEPEGHEPYDVDNGDEPVSEVVVQEDVRIVLIELRSYLEELRHLHVGPELGQVEEDESEDDYSEDAHVLC